MLNLINIEVIQLTYALLFLSLSLQSLATRWGEVAKWEAIHCFWWFFYFTPFLQNVSCTYAVKHLGAGNGSTFSQELCLVLAEVICLIKKGIRYTLSLLIVWGKRSPYRRSKEVNIFSQVTLHGMGVSADQFKGSAVGGIWDLINSGLLTPFIMQLTQWYSVFIFLPLTKLRKIQPPEGLC
jgi:hypothetical protein